jgi:hypothetical protein
VNAAKLLLGMGEAELDILERQVSDLVLLDRAQFSVSLQRLLTMSDPTCMLYSAGRTLLQIAMAELDDLLAHTPLEASYAWALSCASPVGGELQFMPRGLSFSIQATRLKPKRIFPAQYSSVYDVQELEQLESNVIFYADEKGEKKKPTHPLADLFFRTKDGDLVLIDVSGGYEKAAKKKKGHLTKWIAANQEFFTNSTCRWCAARTRNSCWAASARCSGGWKGNSVNGSFLCWNYNETFLDWPEPLKKARFNFLHLQFC